MEDVERVLRRAIELQSDSDLGPDTFDTATVKRIAAELGVDARHVERALFEEQVDASHGPETLLDRVLAPPRMSDQASVVAPREIVEETADVWMERHEGLRKRRILADGALWEKDPSALTKIRMGLHLGEGTGALRSAGSVKHRIHSSPSGEQLVGIDVDTRAVANTGRGLLVAGAALGAVLFVLGAAGMGWAQGLGAALSGFAVFAGAAVITAKTWAGRIRNGMRRALDAIVSPGAVDVHATTAQRVSKLIGAWTDLARTVRKKL